MSLLTYWIVKNSHILAGTYFIFLKNVLYQTWKAFKAKFGPQWKDRESKYQVRQILTLFCELVAKVKTMSEVLQLQKSWNKSNLKESGDGVGAGNCFQRQSFTKYLRQTLVFMEKFSFCFSWDFYKYWQNVCFGWRTGR